MHTYIDAWLEECKHADAIFPYNPELSAYLLQWYELMASRFNDDAIRMKDAAEYVRWAEETVKRSPEFFLYHEHLARALWRRANLKTDSDRNDDFERALREYRKAVDLYPTSSRSWHMYANALEKYAKALEEAGVGDKGAAHLANAKEARERADELQKIVGDR